MAQRGRPRTFDSDDALRKAMLAFWTQGYGNTPMSYLTKVMQLNATSVYAAYGSKEDLFLKAVDHYRKNEGGRIWAAVQSATSPKQVAESLMKKSAEEFTRQDQPKGCLVIMGAILPGSTSQSVYLKLRQLRRDNEHVLVNRFKEVSANDPDSEKRTDWAAVAQFYMTVQQGMSIQASDGVGYAELSGIADSAVAAWDTLVEE